VGTIFAPPGGQGRVVGIGRVRQDRDVRAAIVHVVVEALAPDGLALELAGSEIQGRRQVQPPTGFAPRDVDSVVGIVGPFDPPDDDNTSLRTANKRLCLFISILLSQYL